MMWTGVANQLDVTRDTRFLRGDRFFHQFLLQCATRRRGNEGDYGRSINFFKARHVGVELTPWSF